jgi:hypothetical protein
MDSAVDDAEPPADLSRGALGSTLVATTSVCSSPLYLRRCSVNVMIFKAPSLAPFWA